VPPTPPRCGFQRDDALVLAQSRPVQRAEAVPLDPTGGPPSRGPA
jgi:hypothetical protein